MGREVVLDTVLTRLQISPLTVLFARSGIGKSSFLTCRVMPSMQNDRLVSYMNEWGEDSPDIAIERRINAIFPGSSDVRGTPILILDQFEDVFKIPFDREAMWDKLAEVVNVHNSPIHILISMREEWLGAWEEATDYLPLALTALVRLPPLTQGELARAVERPAAIEGSVTVKAELVEGLLGDLARPNAYGLGDTYVEPGLLQLVCHRLWDEADRNPGRTIDVSIYERLGRAEQIMREFVWNRLGQAGTQGSSFTAADRVLWIGLIRHLILSQGVKAVVSPRALARKLQTRDLGFAGPAVVAGEVSWRSRGYLEAVPEKRDDPPEDVES